ncbi:MAG: hypothetical protein ACHQ52_13360 [Candidatus Eisenbacteria bacterium]
MKQGRMTRALGLTLALAILGAGALSSHAQAAAKSAPTAKPAATAKPARRSAGLHQFSGVVTAVDKTSLTVEKNGRTPKSMTFARHAEMTTQGELERDARVTVFYRDEDGRSVAHRVVVKTAASPSSAN